MLSLHKPMVERLMVRHVVPLFLHVPPWIITVIGIIPAGLFFVFISNGQYVAALVSLLGLFMDSLDGAVARHTGGVTRFGGFLDSVLDRIADALLIAGFGVSGLVPWSLVCVMLVGSFLISYMRSRAELASGGSIKLTAGFMERTERAIGIGMCVVVSIWKPEYVVFVFIVLLALVVLTVFQRGIAAYRLLL